MDDQHTSTTTGVISSPVNTDFATTEPAQPMGLEALHECLAELASNSLRIIHLTHSLIGILFYLVPNETEATGSTAFMVLDDDLHARGLASTQREQGKKNGKKKNE